MSRLPEACRNSLVDNLAQAKRSPSHRARQPNALNFDVRTLLYQLVGIDFPQIHGVDPYLALRLVAECGTDLSR